MGDFWNRSFSERDSDDNQIYVARDPRKDKHFKQELLSNCKAKAGKVGQGKEPLVIAVIGPPGCGKSSFLNTIFAAFSHDRWCEYAKYGEFGRRDITLYGVLTQADKYKSRDPIRLKREKEFMRALGISKNRFARIKNYCPDIVPNMTYKDTIIPSLDVPVLRLMRQVLTAEPTDQDDEHRKTKNSKYVPNISNPCHACVAVTAAIIVALVLCVLFKLFLFLLRI